MNLPVNPIDAPCDPGAIAPLSICMLSDDFLPAATGVGTHLQAIVPELTRRGHRVTVVTTRRPGEPAFEHRCGAEVHRVLTLKAFGFYQALPSTAVLERIFDTARPDIVHHHYLGVMLLQAMRVSERRGLRQVYTYHMTEDHLTQPLPMRPFRRWIARGIVRCCNRMDLVISVSAGIAATLPGKGITTPVITIGNPVDFPSPALAVPAPRDGDFVVMYAGRLEPEKNLPLLIRGFAALLREVPGAVLWLAGRGSRQAALEQLCRDLGVANRVQFLGFLDKPAMAARYAACDVFVLPSLVETQGLVAMEAMWYGKPVVVADSVISARELVEPDVDGYIVDHRRPERITETLAVLARDPAVRQRLSDTARRKAAGWHPRGVVETMLEAYAAVIT
jgi:1,2-diacylglycerol 3-alpha-glucosyltransferase